MTAGLLLLAAALAMLPAPTPRTPGSRLPRRNGEVRSLPGFNTIAAGVVAATAMIFLGIPWGLLLGGTGAWAARRFLPVHFSASEEDEALALARSLPDAVDLLAALLRTGMPDTRALGMLALAVPEPLRHHLTGVARMRELGASATVAWSCTDLPQLAELGRAMSRHAETGAPVAATLDRVAADARREYFTKAQAAARSAAVRAVVPLAACFLPSFLLLGVTPIVASLVGGLTL